LSNLDSLKKLWPYLKRYQWRMLLGMVCVMTSTAAATVAPDILRQAIDGLRSRNLEHSLGYYALGILGATVVTAVFLFLMRKIMIGVSREIEYDLRNDLYKHMQLLSSSYYSRMYTGDLMSRANNDLAAVRMVLGPAIMYSVNTLFTFTFALIRMGWIDWRLMLLALAPLPVVSWLVTRYGEVIHDRFKDVQEQFSRISTTVQENLSGIKVVKAFGREQQEIQEFKKENLQYLQQNRKLVRVWGVLYPAVEMLAGFGILIVLFFGGRYVIRGELTLGEFVAFNTYLAMLIWPAIALGWVVNITQRGAASMTRINEIMNEVPGIRNPETPAVDSTYQIQGKIEFRNVSFGYKPDRMILKDVSFSVLPGQTVAFVGPTGEGKTSLLHLITRMYDPSSGEIFLDDTPLKQFPLDVLRKQIGYVPQDAFLFSDTIEENIAFGMDEAVPEKVAESAQMAFLEEEILSFPQQYKTMIGERGITLSGGQKQRATIARALGKDPAVLILDDSFSNVDTHTEERILQALRQFRQGRTCILVSHRFSTIQDADWIYVLDEGTIAESGKHTPLLNERGLYYDLYLKQLIEEELHIHK
jgi:ATP-binding cassette, subfamily B, multidrug efflux pump